MTTLRRRWQRIRQRAAWRAERRSRAVVGMAQGLVIAIITLLLLRGTALVQGWSSGTLDRWFTLRKLLPHDDAAPAVAILAIDRETRQAWNGRNFDAPSLGRALLLLKQNGITAVALDLPDINRGFWTSPREKAQWQRDLESARIAHLPLDSNFSQNVVSDKLASNQVVAGNTSPRSSTRSSAKPTIATRSVEATSSTDAARVHFGHVFLVVDGDAHVRRLPLILQRDATLYPSLALSTAMQALHLDATQLQLTDWWGNAANWGNAQRLQLGERSVTLGRGGSILLNFWEKDATSQEETARDAAKIPLPILGVNATQSQVARTQTAPTAANSKNAAADSEPSISAENSAYANLSSLVLRVPGTDLKSSTRSVAPLFPTISLVRALRDPQLLRDWRGRCVVIGVTDSQATPQWALAGGARVPEAVVQAIAIDNLLTGSALEPVLPLHLWLLTIALCLVVGGLVAARSPLWSGLVTALALLAVVLLSFGLFVQNRWLDSSLPCLAAALTFLQGVVARARLQERETTRVSSTIEALERAGEIIAARGTSQQLLQQVLGWTLSAMDADAAFAVERNPDFAAGKIAVPRFRVLAIAQNHARALDALPLEAREEIAARVTQQSQPLLISDVHRDLRLQYGRAYYTNYRPLSAPGALSVTSVLAAPLREGDPISGEISGGVQTNGAIFVLNRRDGTPFHARDLELLTAVTDQASVALDNARLYDILNERVARSQSDLQKTNRRLEAEKNTLQTVLESMTDGVVVTDHEGRVQILNPAARALLPELATVPLGCPLAQCLPDVANFSAARMLESQRSFVRNTARSSTRNSVAAPQDVEVPAVEFANAQFADAQFDGAQIDGAQIDGATRTNPHGVEIGATARDERSNSSEGAVVPRRNAEIEYSKSENVQRVVAKNLSTKNAVLDAGNADSGKADAEKAEALGAGLSGDDNVAPAESFSVDAPQIEIEKTVHLPLDLTRFATGAFLPTMQIQRGDVDDTRVIEVRSAPLLSSESRGAGIVWVFSDVTEEKDVEQAKSDFVSFVAHEMRSPLTSISGFSSMLQRLENDDENSDVNDKSSTRSGAFARARDSFSSTNSVREQAARAKDGATRRRFLSVIHNESERLTRLINNLLDVARLEAGRAFELHCESLDFAALAHEAIESQRIYSRRHTLKFVAAPDLPRLFADRDKMLQILINLLSNAMKYSPGGTVEIVAQIENGFFEVSVRDEGPGIAPEHRARLFERFGRIGTKSLAAKNPGAGERAKPTGTGLGLFLTRHLVESHGGRIWLDDQNPRGARFIFALPLQSANCDS